MKELLGKIKTVSFGIFISASIIFALLMIISGGAWISEKAFPWLILINNLGLLITVVILFPLFIFKKTRIISSICFALISVLYAFTAYIWCFLITYYTWGFTGVAIGIMLMGIGVIPIAIIILIMNGAWKIFWNIIFLLALSLALRAFGLYQVSKQEQEPIF